MCCPKHKPLEKIKRNSKMLIMIIIYNVLCSFGITFSLYNLSSSNGDKNLIEIICPYT